MRLLLAKEQSTTLNKKTNRLDEVYHVTTGGLWGVGPTGVGLGLLGKSFSCFDKQAI